MSSKDFLILTLLFTYKHTALANGATVENLISYADLQMEKCQQQDFSLSESTVRRALPSLLSEDYIREGISYGRKKTYYITQKTVEVIVSRERLQSERLALLNSHRKALEQLKNKE